jgi:hypothetical protein
MIRAYASLSFVNKHNVVLTLLVPRATSAPVELATSDTCWQEDCSAASVLLHVATAVGATPGAFEAAAVNIDVQ